MLANFIGPLATHVVFLMCKVPNVGCQAVAGAVACLMVCEVLRCGCLLRVGVIRVVLSWVLNRLGGGGLRGPLSKDCTLQKVPYDHPETK